MKLRIFARFNMRGTTNPSDKWYLDTKGPPDAGPGRRADHLIHWASVERDSSTLEVNTARERVPAREQATIFLSYTNAAKWLKWATLHTYAVEVGIEKVGIEAKQEKAEPA